METLKTFIGGVIPAAGANHGISMSSSAGPKMVSGSNTSGYFSPDKSMPSSKDPARKDKDVYFYIMWRS